MCSSDLGGFGMRMLDLDPLPQPLRARALFGQTARHTRADGRPVRLYRWVDEVPDGLVVVIGHDPCVGDVLLERRGVQGGRMIHLDSAAAKGGPVSALETDRSGRIVGALQADPDGAVLRCVAIEPYDDARTRPDDGASAPGGA